MNLTDVINDGWNVELEKISKRMGDLNDRHWEKRTIWTAKKDEYRLDCEWEGFIDPQDAINDMCKKINAM